MKKVILLLCIICLMLPLCAQAQSAMTITLGGSSWTLHYEETLFSLDNESYLASNRGQHRWFGNFYNGTCTIELAADRYDDLPADCSLFQLADYLCTAMEFPCTVLEITDAPVPFLILSISSPMGNSYYAAAPLGGYVVHFELYNMRGGVDVSMPQVLKILLSGVNK